MKKRYGIVLIALVVAAGSLAAGGQSEASAPTTANPEIVILINTSPWLPGFEAIVERYRAETGNPVRLDVNPFPAMLPKSRNAVIADESEFDLLTLNEQWMLEFYANDWLTPITDVDPTFSLDDGIIDYGNAAYWDQAAGVASPDGTLYAVPINGNIQLFFYRADLFEQAGLDPPATWDEVRTAAELIGNDDVLGFAWRTNPPEWETNAVFESFGGGYVKYNPDSARWEVLIGSQASVEALEYLLDMTGEYGPANFADIGQAQLMGLMQSGRLAQAIIVGAAAPAFDNEEESVVAGQVRAVPVPGRTEDSRTTMTGIWTMGIAHNISDERKRAALDFLEYLLDAEHQRAYTLAGAIPVRQDTYAALSSDPQIGWWMEAFAASTAYISPQLRIPESAQVNEIIKRQIGLAVVGDQNPSEAMAIAADEIFSVLDGAGYDTIIVE